MLLTRPAPAASGQFPALYRATAPAFPLRKTPRGLVDIGSSRTKKNCNHIPHSLPLSSSDEHHLINGLKLAEWLEVAVEMMMAIVVRTCVNV